LYKSLIVNLFYSILLFSLLSAQDDLVIESENYGDRLKIGYVWHGDISFNPLIINYDYDQEFVKLVFGDGLFKRNNNGQIVHNLLFDSKVLSPKALRFQLRPNLLFHDGSLLTAEDVKFSFELYKKFAHTSPRYHSVKLINSIEIYGTDIIRFKLLNHIPDFSETIGKLPILPKNICIDWLKYKSLSDLPDFKPNGFGHFKFIEYEYKRSIKLDSFFNHTLGQSYINGIDFLFFETQDRMLEAFLNEEVDLIQIKDKSEIQKIYQFSKKIIQLDKEERSLYYLNLNTNKKPFDNIGIRRALNFAINKNQIIKYLSTTNSNDTLLDFSKTYVENSQYFASYDYKPLDALQILLNNQYKKNPQGKLVRNKKELQFELFIQKGSLFEESIARIIAINLGDIGINVIPISIESDLLNKKISQGDFQAVLQKYNYNSGQQNIMLRDFYFNKLNNQDGFQNFKNLSIELLLEYARNSGNGKLSTISKRFHNLINRFSPCIFLFSKESDIYAINPRFENIFSTFSPDSANTLNLLNQKHEWFVKKNNQRY
jgi:peptide/nickel transport system substrate-binding protein